MSGLVPIDELLVPLTEEQFKAKAYELAEQLELPVTSWVSGAPTRVVIAILSKIYGGFIAPLLVTITKSGFVDDAEAGWLTFLSKKSYDVDRIEATFATTVELVSNSGGGDYDFDPGDLVFLNSTTDVTYRNVAAVSIDPLQSNVPVEIQADVAGSAGNAAPGEIDTLVTTVLGLTCTNPDAAIGQDAESDTELRERDRLSLGALSPNGPPDVYRYIALTPALNGDANIDRVKVIPATGELTVTVILAAPGGSPTPGDVDLVDDAYALLATPEVVTVSTEGCGEEPLTYGVTLHVSAAANLSDPEWEELAKTTLVDYVNSLPIGGIELTVGNGFVFWRAVEGVLERIQTVKDGPYYVLHAELDSETDVAIGDTDVATLDPGDITVTVVQVAS